MNKNITIGDFKIGTNTKFWIFVLHEINWNDLKANYDKGLYYVSSYTKPNVKKNDVVIVYLQHSSNKLAHGIVSICQLKNNLSENVNKIKLFRDVNINKYIAPLCVLNNYDDPYKISQMEKFLSMKCPLFKSADSFKKKYIKEKTTFIELDKMIGIEIIRLIVECSDKLNLSDISTVSTDSISSGSTNPNKKIRMIIKKVVSERCPTDEDSDSCSEWGSSADDTNSEYVSSADDDDDCIRIIDGHIPIILIPCKNFRWSNDEELMIHEFKSHLTDCKNCEITDNNNVSIYKNLDSSVFTYEELTDSEQIDSKLEKYYNCSNCTFELEGKNKHLNHIFIYKINCRDHIYHRSLLIIW